MEEDFILQVIFKENSNPTGSYDSTKQKAELELINSTRKNPEDIYRWCYSVYR